MQEVAFNSLFEMRRPVKLQAEPGSKAFNSLFEMHVVYNHGGSDYYCGAFNSLLEMLALISAAVPSAALYVFQFSI